jgi:hypothetical protein
MDEFYIGQIFEGIYPPGAAQWCGEHNATIDELEPDEKGRRFQIVEVEPHEITAADYDRAMEEHIYRTRAERGYTTREPSSSCYLHSMNPRWKQDALDWIDFINEVMTYALQIQNDYVAGKEVPTLEEFKANLPVITWNWRDL